MLGFPPSFPSTLDRSNDCRLWKLDLTTWLKDISTTSFSLHPKSWTWLKFHVSIFYGCLDSHISTTPDGGSLLFIFLKQDVLCDEFDDPERGFCLLDFA
jgi:hypothetical protein